MKDNSFKKYAVFITNQQTNETYFYHIGLHPQHRYMYGVKPNEEIYEVEFEIHEDQETKPDFTAQEYWGWLDTENDINKMTMIFPNYVSFLMCFPYGVEAAEQHGQGKSYRLKVKSYKKVEV
jgi:hypothetical protein